MRYHYRGGAPHIHPTATVAPGAVLVGAVRIEAHARILPGAVLTAESGPVTVGAHAIVMEQAVLRGTRRAPLHVGQHVLIGPRAALSGCTVEDCAFVATGATVLTGAVIGRGAEVRIHGVVHISTVLPPDSTVPIGWVAVGDPAEILPPEAHERIWARQRPLDFPRTVFGLERDAPQRLMPRLTERYGRLLAAYDTAQVLAGDE